MPIGTSPTARALYTLEILQTRPGTTAGQLAEKLGVTERAARRYVGILREAGIAVESVRGPHGGYRLRRGTRLPPVVFTQDEAIGLVMAVLDGRPAAADGEDLVGSALRKVVQALPEAVGRQAALLRDHAAAAPDRERVLADPATTSALVAAVAARRRVRIGYRERGRPGVGGRRRSVGRGRAVRTLVSAVPFASRRGGPHLPRRPDPGGAADFRKRSGCPKGWIPSRRWRRTWASAGPSRPAWCSTLRPSRWRRGSGRRWDGWRRTGERCVLVGSTRNPVMYVQEWLASIPFAFHVEGGDELRGALAELAAVGCGSRRR